MAFLDYFRHSSARTCLLWNKVKLAELIQKTITTDLLTNWKIKFLLHVN